MASPTPTMPGGNVPALRLNENQNVVYTATAGTIATAVKSTVVRVVCTTAAFIKIGVEAVATVSDTYVASNSPEYFRCVAGDKVSAIRESVSGTLYITEMD